MHQSVTRITLLDKLHHYILSTTPSLNRHTRKLPKHKLQ